MTTSDSTTPIACYNDCGRSAVGSYYIGRERAQLCAPCLREQDERDQETVALGLEDEG